MKGVCHRIKKLRKDNLKRRFVLSFQPIFYDKNEFLQNFSQFNRLLAN